MSEYRTRGFQAKVKRAKAEEETLSRNRLEIRKSKKAGQTIKLQKEVKQQLHNRRNPLEFLSFPLGKEWEKENDVMRKRRV